MLPAVAFGLCLLIPKKALFISQGPKQVVLRKDSSDHALHALLHKA